MTIIEKLNGLIDLYYEKIKEVKDANIFELRELSDMNSDLMEEEHYDGPVKKAIDEHFEKKYNNKSSDDIVEEQFEIQDFLKRLVASGKEEENNLRRDLKYRYKKEIDQIRNIIDQLRYAPINLRNVYEQLKNLSIPNSMKAEYMREISVYAEIKNKKYEEEKRRKEEKEKLEKEKKESLNKQEEKDEKIKNHEYIESIIQKHGDLILQNVEGMKFEGVFSDSDLDQILNLYFVDFSDDELFNTALSTLFFNITKTDNKEEIQKISNDIDVLCKKYELLTNLTDLDNIIKDLYARFNITGNEVSLLTNIQNEIQKIKGSEHDEKVVSEFIDETYNKIYEIRKQKFASYINSDPKLQAKAFVLFDYDKTKKHRVPYILSDLNENDSENQIDESIKKEKIVSNGYNDFNDLIDDLIMYGAPEITLQKNDKLNKLIRPVYYLDNQYDNINSSMKNSSGMFRIKPRLTSYLRFMDEKVVYAPNTPKMKQIKELLESRLPNISIDSSRSFILFINYLDAFKAKELDSYSTSLKRKDNSELQQILKTKSDSYNAEELYKIGKAIDMTLEAYQDLKEINSNFRFNTVDKLTNNDQVISLD